MKRLCLMVLIYFSNLCWSDPCIPTHTLNNLGAAPEVRLWSIQRQSQEAVEKGSINPKKYSFSPKFSYLILQTKTTAENKIHTIYYIHAKSATLEKRKETVTCLIELWTYLINTRQESQKTPILRILRETYNRETTEFVSLFPSVKCRQTYNPVQRLYRIILKERKRRYITEYIEDVEEKDIYQVEPKCIELNKTDVCLLEKGFELLLSYNKVEELVGTSTNINSKEAMLKKKIMAGQTFRQFIALSGNMEIENTDSRAINDHSDIYDQLSEDVFSNMCVPHESKKLFTYTNDEYTEKPIFECFLLSENIKKSTKRFYVLRKTKVKETFLYIQQSQSLTLVENFLKFGEQFADDVDELVYVVQKVNLFPPFIVAFRDFNQMFFSEDSLTNIVENIKEKLP